MKEIFNMKKCFALATIVLLLSGLYSCLDDDDNYIYSTGRPSALVTVKPIDSESFYLQLDDKRTLLPVNIKSSPYGEKEVRALVNFKLAEEPSGDYDEAVYINWIDSILTKPMSENLELENDEVYGKDPVEIVRDRVTIAEDGYLTLRFRTKWSGSQVHYVNLISTNNPDNPYEVEFRHNAHGDTYGRYGDGLVAFKLDSLPDTEGKTVKLKLKWKSFTGEKATEFDYCSRQATLPDNPDAEIVRNEMNLK